MDDRQIPTPDDLLEQATRALRQTPVPNGPSGDALTDVVAALEDAANQPTTPTLIQGIRAMNLLTKITAAAASLLIICGTTAWMMTTGGGASVALADVANVLDEIRSATYTGTSTTEGKPARTGKNMYLDPSRCRMESSHGIVMIYGESKMISLNPQTKFAAVVTLEDVPDDGIMKNWIEEVRQQIHEAIGGSKDAVKELGRGEVDGRDAVGFRLRVRNSEMTVWADPVTALPIRVESTSGILQPKSHHVLNNFRYNVDLDESLFSLEPPEGYTVQEMSMDASTPQERDFVEILRIYTAEQENGLFPPTLSGSEIEKRVTHRIQEEISAQYGDWRADAEMRNKVMQSDEFKEFMELGKKLGRGLGFLFELPPDVDWHYAGKDVKLGASDRPIFWYQPTGSENYRVIYADLSATEVAAEALKGFPESSGPE